MGLQMTSGVLYLETCRVDLLPNPPPSFEIDLSSKVKSDSQQVADYSKFGCESVIAFILRVGLGLDSEYMSQCWV